MIVLLALALQAPALPSPPATDWSELPVLRWVHAPTVDEQVTAFVRGEVAAGRCALAAVERRITVDLALLVTASGSVRRLVPRAINCPTVEQYTSGLVWRATRGNIANLPAADSWYRATVTFAWKP